MTTSTQFRLAVLSLEAIDTVARLGAKLAEIESARDALVAELDEGIAAKVKTTPAAVHRDRQQRARLFVDRLTLPSALAAALWHAGVGRRGVKIDARLVDIGQVGERDDGVPFNTQAEIETVLAQLAQLTQEIAA